MSLGALSFGFGTKVAAGIFFPFDPGLLLCTYGGETDTHTHGKGDRGEVIHNVAAAAWDDESRSREFVLKD